MRRFRALLATPWVWRLSGFLVVLYAGNFLIWPERQVLIPRRPQIDLSLHATLARVRPDVVLLGNSMLGEGIDNSLFSRLTGARSLVVALGGSASAVWYCVVKNVILTAPHRPRALVIFFRDAYLTDPTFRVRGHFSEFFDRYAGADEPLLDRLAFLGGMGTLEYTLYRHWPLYRERERAKRAVEATVFHAAARWLLGLEDAEARAAMNRVFVEERMVDDLVTRRQLAEEQRTAAGRFDFQGTVQQSFLPSLIELTGAAGVELILVRVRRRRVAEGGGEPGALARYIADLRRFLDERRVSFIDFARDERLRPAHFARGDHLNRTAGRPLFTTLVARALRPLLDALRR